MSIGVAIAAAKEFDSLLQLCGRHGTQACAFSAGSATATKAKWATLLARISRAPINVGGTHDLAHARLFVVKGYG